MNDKSKAPSASEYFDKAYKAPITFWGDVRMPEELKELVEKYKPQTSLELGCGLGRFSAFMAKQGIKATGVDFSPVAIEKAKKRVANNEQKPTFIVGDVTNLEMLTGPFDVSFDIGCFHCLNEDDQQKYISEIYRLLKPGAPHLLWTMDHAPNDMPLNPNYIAKVFENRFKLVNFKLSRRRIISSHWYWLVRERLNPVAQ
jgi:ubiquinone/menaquinone biosynthesis C-methylase UbiE